MTAFVRRRSCPAGSSSPGRARDVAPARSSQMGGGGACEGSSRRPARGPTESLVSDVTTWSVLGRPAQHRVSDTCCCVLLARAPTELRPSSPLSERPRSPVAGPGLSGPLRCTEGSFRSLESLMSKGFWGDSCLWQKQDSRRVTRGGTPVFPPAGWAFVTPAQLTPLAEPNRSDGAARVPSWGRPLTDRAVSVSSRSRAKRTADPAHPGPRASRCAAQRNVRASVWTLSS